MNSGTEHPGKHPTKPRDPQPRVRVEYEVPEDPPRDGPAASVLVMMFVFGSAMTGYFGVDLLRHGDWRSGLGMLGVTAMFLSSVPFLWRSRRGHVDPVTGKDRAIEATESRAMLQALEHHDRLLAEARVVGRVESSGEPGPTRRPDEIEVERSEPTDRGFEAKIAARMKERGDPG